MSAGQGEVISSVFVLKNPKGFRVSGRGNDGRFLVLLVCGVSIAKRCASDGRLGGGPLSVQGGERDGARWRGWSVPIVGVPFDIGGRAITILV